MPVKIIVPTSLTPITIARKHLREGGLSIDTHICDVVYQLQVKQKSTPELFTDMEIIDIIDSLCRGIKQLRQHADVIMLATPSHLKSVLAHFERDADVYVEFFDGSCIDTVSVCKTARQFHRAQLKSMVNLTKLANVLYGLAIYDSTQVHKLMLS